MILGKEKIMEFERGNARSNSLENSLWKRPWTCRKTDYTEKERMNERVNEKIQESCETWPLILTEHTFQICENTVFDHIRNEDILGELKAETVDEKLRRYNPTGYDKQQA
jgi:hypothetical protein